MKTNRDEPIARAILPEVMFVPDIALALRVGENTARKAVLRGDLGPFLRLGRRVAVLRESFLAALERRQEVPRPHLVQGDERAPEERSRDE